MVQIGRRYGGGFSIAKKIWAIFTWPACAAKCKGVHFIWETEQEHQEEEIRAISHIGNEEYVYVLGFYCDQKI